MHHSTSESNLCTMIYSTTHRRGDNEEYVCCTIADVLQNIESYGISDITLSVICHVAVINERDMAGRTITLVSSLLAIFFRR